MGANYAILLTWIVFIFIDSMVNIGWIDDDDYIIVKIEYTALRISLKVVACIVALQIFSMALSSLISIATAGT